MFCRIFQLKWKPLRKRGAEEMLAADFYRDTEKQSFADRPPSPIPPPITRRIDAQNVSRGLDLGDDVPSGQQELATLKLHENALAIAGRSLRFLVASQSSARNGESPQTPSPLLVAKPMSSPASGARRGFWARPRAGWRTTSSG